MDQNILIKQDNTRYKSIGMLLVAATLWSFGGLLIKLVNLHPIAIAGIRSIITALVILIFLGKPEWKWSLNKFCGAIAYTSMVFLFVCATKLTTAANAILLQYTSPIYIAIFGGVLLKEKAKLRDWITIGFVLLGMILFFVDSLAIGNLKGNLIAIGSGVALAFNTIFMRRQKDSNPMENVFWGNIITFIISMPWTFKSSIDTKSWIGLILLGVFQLGLSYVLYSKAIKHITALESTLISVIEPILNPLWVFVVVGELPSKWAIIGGTIVLISVTINCIKSNMEIKQNNVQTSSLS